MRKRILTEDDLLRTSTIVIANYDSHENSKKGADIVISKGENASKKINDAIQSLKGTGGEVKLMEGEYNLEYGIAVNVPNVHFTGVPRATILKQSEDWRGDPLFGRKHIIDSVYKIEQTYVSNLIIEGANINGSNGFTCYGSSQVENCIVNNAGRKGFETQHSSKLINCVSNNSRSDGFSCTGSSQIINCISNNSKESGFYCREFSQIKNCTSNYSERSGFLCEQSSQIINCISSNSTTYGFMCMSDFVGICSFNILKGDTLKDSSISSAIVEYNIIQEEAK